MYQIIATLCFLGSGFCTFLFFFERVSDINWHKSPSGEVVIDGEVTRWERRKPEFSFPSPLHLALLCFIGGLLALAGNNVSHPENMRLFLVAMFLFGAWMFALLLDLLLIFVPLVVSGGREWLFSGPARLLAGFGSLLLVGCHVFALYLYFSFFESMMSGYLSHIGVM